MFYFTINIVCILAQNLSGGRQSIFSEIVKTPENGSK